MWACLHNRFKPLHFLHPTFKNLTFNSFSPPKVKNMKLWYVKRENKSRKRTNNTAEDIQFQGSKRLCEVEGQLDKRSYSHTSEESVENKKSESMIVRQEDREEHAERHIRQEWRASSSLSSLPFASVTSPVKDDSSLWHLIDSCFFFLPHTHSLHGCFLCSLLWVWTIHRQKMELFFWKSILTQSPRPL